MKPFFVTFLALWLAAPAAGQSVQARFDAATAKRAAKDLPGALSELESLETFLVAQPKPNQFNLAVTRAIKADVLLDMGRLDEARNAVDAALGGPWLDRAGLEITRDAAISTAARLREADLDHASASSLFLSLAEKTGDQIMKTSALVGAARNEMFVNVAGALGHIDEALKLAEANETVGKAQLANVLGLKGRILLSAGKYAEAKTLLVRAVNLRGGLTSRTDLGDVTLRADAGIAMLRLGDVEQARRYLAFSGAGHTDVPLSVPLDAPLPSCGGEADIAPDDVAVIEFTVLDDGRVVSPRPVFASKQGEMAYVFARAVGDWSWDPDKAKAVKLFFRYSPRVELRCTNRAQRPALVSEFSREADAWLAARNVAQLSGSEAELAIRLTSQLNALPAGDQSVRRLGLLMQLQDNYVLPEETRREYAAQALTLARTLKAPPALIFTLTLDAGWHSIPGKASWRREAELRVQLYRSMLSNPEFADPRMRAVLQIMMAGELATVGRADEEVAALRSVIDQTSLPERDPVKVAALVSLANAYAAKGDLISARAAYARTGLSAQQCALLDNGPVLTGSGFGTFPPEAYNWGFDGWTAMEYDVTADGRTNNARVVYAYPPQVFSEASVNAARTVRYRVSFRPEGDVACTAMQRRVRFTKP